MRTAYGASPKPRILLNGAVVKDGCSQVLGADGVGVLARPLLLADGARDTVGL